MVTSELPGRPPGVGVGSCPHPKKEVSATNPAYINYDLSPSLDPTTNTSINAERRGAAYLSRSGIEVETALEDVADILYRVGEKRSS